MGFTLKNMLSEQKGNKKSITQCKTIGELESAVTKLFAVNLKLHN